MNAFKAVGKGHLHFRVWNYAILHSNWLASKGYAAGFCTNSLKDAGSSPSNCSTVASVFINAPLADVVCSFSHALPTHISLTSHEVESNTTGARTDHEHSQACPQKSQGYRQPCCITFVLLACISRAFPLGQRLGHAPDTGPPFTGTALVSIQGFIDKLTFLCMQAQAHPPILQVHAQAPASLATEVAIKGSSERRPYFDKSRTVVNVCLSILCLPCQ